MHRFAIIAGIRGELTSSCLLSRLLFLLFPVFFFILFSTSLSQPKPFLCLSSSLISPVSLHPLWFSDHPVGSSLCAPAVPLLWLQFVLLCFCMATIEPATSPPSPIAAHPAPFLFPLLRSCPCLFPLTAHVLKESSKGGFCVPCRCPGWVKRGRQVCGLPTVREGGYSARGSPTCGRS